MKRMAMIAASALLLGGGLAAQDTTQAAAPAAATPQVTVVEAVVARSVVDRQPQDTGATFPVGVGQLHCWTKVEGAGGSSVHHAWVHGDTQVGGGGTPGLAPARRPPPPPPPPTPLQPPASPRSPETISGAVAGRANVSRRDTSVRGRVAGWTGGDTVSPVSASEPLLLGVSTGSSRTRVGVRVRLTTRPCKGTGSADAVTVRRRVGAAGRTAALAGPDRPGPSRISRIARLTCPRGGRTGSRARGWIGRLRGVEAFPSRGITLADDPRIDSASVRLDAAAGAASGRRPRWWNRPSLMQGDQNGSHSARSANTFCWNPMKVQSVHVGYIGYGTPVSCCIA